MKKVIKTIWHYIKILAVVLFIIIEELAWRKIGEPVYESIQALGIMRRFRQWVSNVKHRYALLAIFLGVFFFMEITSTYGLILMGRGAVYSGIFFYSIKLFLTVPAVVIFNVGKDILLTFWFIKYIYGLVLRMKRSRVFRKAKAQLYKYQDAVIAFKNIYLTGDGKISFVDSIKTIYQDMKKKK